MAKKEQQKTVSRRMWMIDPIYRKFTAQAFKNLTGTEFYNFFMTMLKNGEHEFQFSNRKLDMQVDKKWVEIIEETIPAFMEITRNPRVIITQEELITNVVQARRIDSQVVKHLCAHSYLVDSLDENNDVRPGKVLNIFKEESWNTYENRFVYTLMRKTYDFIRKRYMDMQDALNDEYGATLLIKSTGNSKLETLSIDSKLKITQIDDLFDTEDKQGSIFARIKYIYDSMCKLMETRFAKELAKFPKVDPPLVATNAIKKNPHLRKCHKLWDFLLTYFDVGYTIQIIEQNPEINEKFEQDIFDNIMFTYIILKGYLEDNRDRAMDRRVKSQRTFLRPRYIKQIVEDIVRDFNIPDVEVRKILIEQLTKEQLMREARSEQYRLIAEKRKAEEDKKRQAELDRIRRAKERERQKKLLEKEKAKAKIRAEKEKAKEAERLKKEKEKKAEADAKRAALFEQELTQQLGSVETRRKKNTAKVKRAAVKTKKETAKTGESAAKKTVKKAGTTGEKAAKKTAATGEKKKRSTPKAEVKKTKRTAVKKAPVQLTEEVKPTEEVKLPEELKPMDAPVNSVPEQAAELPFTEPVAEAVETAVPAEPVTEVTEQVEAESVPEEAAEPLAEGAAEVTEPTAESAEETVPEQTVPESAAEITESVTEAVPETPDEAAEAEADEPSAEEMSIEEEIASVVESVISDEAQEAQPEEPEHTGRFGVLRKILGRK